MRNENNFTFLPKGLKRKCAAAYCGFSLGHFNRGIREGWLPQPIDVFGVKLWLRESLDSALEAFEECSEQGETDTCENLFKNQDSDT